MCFHDASVRPFDVHDSFQDAPRAIDAPSIRVDIPDMHDVIDVRVVHPLHVMGDAVDLAGGRDVSIAVPGRSDDVQGLQIALQRARHRGQFRVATQRRGPRSERHGQAENTVVVEHVGERSGISLVGRERIANREGDKFGTM